MEFWLAFRVSTELIAVHRLAHCFPSGLRNVIWAGESERVHGRTVKVRVWKKVQKSESEFHYCWRRVWWGRLRPAVAASRQLLSVLQSSPCAHRVHRAAAAMSPSLLATPITARRLSEPFGCPVRLMRCDWVCAASAQAVVPFIQPPVMYGDFPSRSLQGGTRDLECVWYVYGCLCADCWVCAACVHLSVRRFAFAGVQNWFTAVEKIIVNWLMVKVCPGGLCVYVCAGARECVSAWPRSLKVSVPSEVCGK